MNISESTVETLLESLAETNVSLSTASKHLRNDLEDMKALAEDRAREIVHLNANNRAYIHHGDFRKLFDPEFVTIKKIETIKMIRTITGMGLKDSKELLEEFLIPFMEGVMKNDTRGIYHDLPKAPPLDPETFWEDNIEEEDNDY